MQSNAKVVYVHTLQYIPNGYPRGFRLELQFQQISDELFRSFDTCVNPSSFAELSGT